MKTISLAVSLGLLALSACASPEDGAKELEKVAQLSAGPTLSCTASYQPNGPGTDVSTKNLAIAEQDASSMTLRVEHEGYSYEVIWNRPLTTLYMTISKGGDTLGFSTARIPDNNHNDSQLDIGGMPRMWLSCDFVEFRPKP